MAYTPKTWQCGEPIMADDLNHMEQGIAQGGGKLIVTETVSGATHTLDHTWQEISDAFPNVDVVLATTSGAIQTSISHLTRAITFRVFVIDQGATTRYEASSADGYPSYTKAQQ